MKLIFVGVDLAITNNKSLLICLCYWEGNRLTPFPAQLTLETD